MQGVYDQIFDLTYYSNFTFTEGYNLPVRLRRSYYDKLRERKEREKEAAQGKNKHKL